MSVASSLDYEDVDSYNLRIVLRNDYGAYSTKDVVVSVLDVDEYNVTTPYDANPSSSYVSENLSYGATVGITAQASDADDTNNTITYSDNSGLFSVHPSTGVVTLSGALDYETATSHSVTITATSSDGSSASRSFCISVGDYDEYNVTTPYDANPSSSYVSENLSYGATVGITAQASDADDTNNTITYSDNSGLFSVHPSTGVVTLSGALDYETATSHSVTITATSADGSSKAETFNISVVDVNEVPSISTGASGSVVENAPHRRLSMTLRPVMLMLATASRSLWMVQTRIFLA